MKNRIAIIGYGANLPGATCADEFFQNLLSGKNIKAEIPAQIANIDSFYYPNSIKHGKTRNKWGSFVDSVADYTQLVSDQATYTKLSFKHKLLIDAIYQAIQSTGSEISQFQKHLCSVVIAASSLDQCYENTSDLNLQHVINDAGFMLANCISYLLNLQGLSYTLDTGQSSSLVALNEACKHLLSHDVDSAIVASVNIISSPLPSIAYSQAGLQSADGYCKSFNADADGFVRGEGSIALVLKRLEDAERDGDFIYSIIHASHVNHAGYSAGGLVSPNLQSQFNTVAACFKKAELNVDKLDYIEAHGSGTSVGDAIEFQALQTVINESTSKRNYCGIGSVKSYLGHLEAAAGLAGVLKSIMMLNQQVIAPSYHFQTPNSQCDFIDSPFYFTDRAKTKSLNLIGVNSIGLGGTISHVIIGRYLNKKSKPNFTLASQRIQRWHADAKPHSSSSHNLNDSKFLAELLSELLNTPISIAKHADIPFTELGVNSLLATEMVSRLQIEFSRDLPATLLFDYTTISKLHQYLLDNKSNHLIKYEADHHQDEDPIVIVGVALRCADANDIHQFWNNLVANVDSIRPIPQERWDVNTYYQSKHDASEGSIYCKFGNFLNDIDQFDADFFHISHREAIWMDPQQRLLLELSWQCLEQCGALTTEHKTGVFIGASYSHYRELFATVPETRYSGTGNSNALLANRISYFFNLTGPSIVIDTLCSSSLVALDIAIKQIRAGQCQQALVGAAHIALSPNYYQRYCRLQALSEEGHCAAFSEAGDGYVPGEGGVMLLLKPLSLAKKAKDKIYAIIRGTAVNHGGQASGLTVPNSQAQKNLILAALNDANLSASEITYVEAHGTGTTLGDPIEVAGLSQAFQESTDKKQYCALGAVKSNIGHTEPAAGFFGIAKVIMSFAHQYLPANLHLNEPNRHINFVGTPFYFVDKGMPWRVENNKKRFAGISSFGMGGANAHTILEEWQEDALMEGSTQPYMILLSADSEFALTQKIKNLLRFIKSNNDVRLIDIAFSLAVGVKHFEHRVASVVNNREELVQFLEHPERFNWQASPLISTGIKRYLAGENINWLQFQDATYAKRVALPTYPFERKSYWVTASQVNLQHNSYNHLLKHQLQLSEIPVSKEPIDLFILNDDPLISEYNLLSTFQDHEIKFICYDDATSLQKYHNKSITLAILISAVTNNEALYQFIQKISREDIHISINLYIFYSNDKTNHRALESDGFVQIINSESKNVIASRIAYTGKWEEHTDTIRQLINSKPQHTYLTIDKEGVFYYQEDSLVPNSSVTNAITKDAVFVITGGNGGIACELTKYLINRYHCKVVLLSKAVECRFFQLNPQPNWRNHVTYHAVDLNNCAAVQRTFAAIEEEFDAITGVIHLAGIMDKTASMQKKSYADICAISKSKIDGTIHIIEACTNLNPEFILLNSSLASIQAQLSKGKAGYVLGNVFINSLAVKLNQQGVVNIKTVIWPAWHGIGMMQHAVDHATTAAFSITLESGLRHFDYCITHAKSLPAVLIINSENNQSINLLVTEQHTKQEAKHSIKNNLSIITQVLSTVIQKTINETDFNISFSSFGIDSLMLADMIDEFEKHGIKISPTDILSYNTVSKLHEFLNEQAPSIIDGHSASETITSSSQNETRIAVIGMACHFAGANSLQEFWENLLAGKCAINEIPEERWRRSTYYSEFESPVLGYAKHAALINDIWKFDAAYFQFKPHEAGVLDPQQRLFLKIANEVLTDAGYARHSQNLKHTGVFIGARMNHYGHDYFATIKDNNSHDNPYQYDRMALLGRSQNFIASWVSDRFDLHGPALTVDTACSSSLMSLHLACNSILNHECEMAIAGGVDLLLDEQMLVLLSKAKALSRDGLIKTFDKDANGYVIGEGAGAVLLKRLDKALADGDFIYCTILASGANNDGKTMGITTPNVAAQEALLDSIYQRANIHPRSITYIEAHGTGTQIGDPIEINSLTRAYRKQTADKGFCAIGSVKTNIGHLHSAAGISAFIKTALTLHHEKLVPTIHCNEPNSRLNLLESPFYINAYLRDWSVSKMTPKRRAGVSSFGFGGTNVHVVMEEYKHKNIKRQIERHEYQEKEHYMMPMQTKQEHPLLDECHISTAGKIHFTKKFSDIDIIINDHKVDAKKMLPGVTWLELVRAAFMQFNPQSAAVQFETVLFHSPLIVLPNETITVTGMIEKNQFTLQSDKLHATGIIKAVALEQNKFHTEYKIVDSVEANDLFSLLRKLGYIHAEFFQNINALQVSSEKDVIVKLQRNKRTDKERKAYWLDPGLIDSATLGPFATKLSQIVADTGCPFVPLCIESLTVYGPLPDTINAHVYIEKWNSETGRVSITFYDNDSCIIAKMNNLAYKRYSIENKNKLDHQFLFGNWQPCNYTSKEIEEIGTYIAVSDTKIPLFSNLTQQIFMTNQVVNMLDLLVNKHQATTLLIHAPSKPDRLDPESLKEYRNRVVDCIAVVQNIIKSLHSSKLIHRINLIIIEHNSDINTPLTPVAAFFKTLSLEFPKLNCKYLFIDDLSIDLHAILKTELSKTNKLCFYFEGKRYERFVAEMKPSEINRIPIFKKRMNCLIIGGLGGIGKQLANYLAQHYQARLGLITRSNKHLDNHAAYPKQAHLFIADASKAEELDAVFAEFSRKVGHIDFVIHAAANTKDSLVISSKKVDIENTFIAKVDIYINLLSLTKKYDVKHFVALSSIVAEQGNIGQSIYAAANAFMDEASYLIQTDGPTEIQVQSQAWYPWNGIGLAQSDKIQSILKKRQFPGFDINSAIHAFEHAASIISNTLIIKPKLKYNQGIISMYNKLKSILETTLKLSIKNDNATFLELGFTSSELIEATMELEKKLNTTFYPTIFFEYQTPKAFIEYLIETNVQPQPADSEKASSKQEPDSLDAKLIELLQGLDSTIKTMNSELTKINTKLSGYE